MSPYRVGHQHKWRALFTAPVLWQKGNREVLRLREDPVIETCACGLLSAKPFNTRHLLSLVEKDDPLLKALKEDGLVT